MGVYGLGTMVMVLFPTDQIDEPADLAMLTAAGTVHVIGALVGFSAVLTAMSVLSWTFTRDARWRRLAPWSALFPAVALTLFMLQSEGPLVGLVQRLMIATISAWTVLVVLRTRVLIPGATRPKKTISHANRRHS